MNGIGGKVTTYTDELKSKVIADIVLGTTSLKAIAKKHDIPYGTIRTWSSRLNKNVSLIETEKKQDIGDLLLQVLQLNLNAQMAQMEVFANVEWLEKQSANELAILHGVLNDKAVRLIEAFKNGHNSTRD